MKVLVATNGLEALKRIPPFAPWRRTPVDFDYLVQTLQTALAMKALQA